jgi:hypothetical protein
VGGSGYSSLSYLKHLPVSEIKSDKSFVMNTPQDLRDQSIVAAAIHMAHSLGLHSVAEGVENDLVLGILRRADCDTGQGYHWSRPVPHTSSTPGSTIAPKPEAQSEMTAAKGQTGPQTTPPRSPNCHAAARVPEGFRQGPSPAPPAHPLGPDPNTTANNLSHPELRPNEEQRWTLDWATPAEALNQLLSEPFNNKGVATTA